MSADEVIVTLAAAAFGPVAWIIWFARTSGSTLPGRGSGGLGVLAATIVACSTLLLYVLVSWASRDVQTAIEYLFMYSVMGLAWLRLAELSFAYAGVSARDDVVERGNTAATIALSGALVAVMLCFAGGNIGDGPGWRVVVFSAALATGGLLVSWQLVAAFTSITDAVTIDRDPAAGVRLAAFLVAAGLILGRAVAGDWHSADAAVDDFLRASPAVVLLVALAIVIERIGRPTTERPRQPFVSHGLGLGGVYVLVALVALAYLGWPE